jgi:hypothetical protein
VSRKVIISEELFDGFRTLWRKGEVVQEFYMRNKMLLISGGDLEFHAERLGKLLSQSCRLKREGTVKEATRAQKPAFDSSSATRRQKV